VPSAWTRGAPKRPQPAESQPRGPWPVGLIRAGRGRVEATVTNTRAGTVRARRRALLSPEASGLVVALPVAEGERVAEGDVLVRLARATPDATITAVDGSEPMLGLAREAVASAGLNGRVRLVTARLPALPFEARSFDAVLSKDLLHHLAALYQGPYGARLTVAAIDDRLGSKTGRDEAMTSHIRHHLASNHVGPVCIRK